MCKMRNRFIGLGFMILVFCFLGFLTYKTHFERRLETRHYVNEIIKLKIDSCQISKYTTHTSYDFFVEGKYLVSIDSTRYVPFKLEADVDVHAKNVLGEFVVTDWSHSCWESDIDKFIKHFRVYLIVNKESLVYNNYVWSIK